MGPFFLLSLLAVFVPMYLHRIHSCTMLYLNLEGRCMSPSLTLGSLCSARQAVITSPALLSICTCLFICPCLPCWPVCAVPVLAVQMCWLLAAGFQEGIPALPLDDACRGVAD